MKKIKLNKKLLFSTLGVLGTITAVTAIATSCGGTSDDKKVEAKAQTVNSGSYATQMKSLATGEITVAAGWGDAAAVYAKDYRDDIIIVGATTPISNDGIQVRGDLKKGDIQALQALFINTIKVANENLKAGKEELTMKIKDKNKTVFAVYNHDGYSAITDLSAEIPINPSGDMKKLYSSEPAEGSDYLTVSPEGVVSKVEGSKNLKIQFIPSGDPAHVTAAVGKISDYFKNTLKLDNIEITVGTDYNAAAIGIEEKSLDVAFLPVDTWATKSPSANFIVQAGREVQIVDPYVSVKNVSTPAIKDEKILIDAMNNYRTFNKVDNKPNLYVQGNNPTAETEGYPKALKDAVDKIATEAGNDKAKLPVVGFYRSYIYVKKDSVFAKKVLAAIKTQGTNWKLEWKDVAGDVIFGYTSKTSSASYTFAEKWFQTHFNGFTTFEEQKNK
ncbi:PhnD/SsuA/transferrin family substrate-binding protein [Ureaplasma miroungigenitalium]|uniref:PhnD/SsuA/transferrin family substrate-binding protein n=1 Tax=Ureaplasma miroungigenitalium TaxID=1042321 RepID=A0ABT3BM70_9BACT|nr:PhnD/SsuA/transferrin family substrate-binding protein [Ureaplasma miroungigenitalium]MCV3728336.1 PhnD/SsuA/transferrin family substrate-binding protein [Ureaplasma miroungigenitalium]MCV3734123.1 PhnD/SsuA/transferrin family substrate-binding protein [Ureaplasma miroungigenitalium]